MAETSEGKRLFICERFSTPERAGLNGTTIPARPALLTVDQCLRRQSSRYSAAGWAGHQDEENKAGKHPQYLECQHCEQGRAIRACMPEGYQPPRPGRKEVQRRNRAQQRGRAKWARSLPYCHTGANDPDRMR